MVRLLQGIECSMTSSPVTQDQQTASAPVGVANPRRTRL